MKKKLITIFIFSLLINLWPGFVDPAEAAYKVNIDCSSMEESKEILYQDIFMALLNQDISKAVEQYHGVPYTVDPWDARIINIERPNGYRTFYFILKLQIMPYIGPHNTVGIDNITLSIDAAGVKVLKFEHIEDTPLTPEDKRARNNRLSKH